MLYLHVFQRNISKPAFCRHSERIFLIFRTSVQQKRTLYSHWLPLPGWWGYHGNPFLFFLQLHLPMIGPDLWKEKFLTWGLHNSSFLWGPASRFRFFWLLPFRCHRLCDAPPDICLKNRKVDPKTDVHFWIISFCDSGDLFDTKLSRECPRRDLNPRPLPYQGKN